MTPGWAHWLALIVVVGTLAFIGSSADRPLLDVPAVVPRVRKLSADIVQRAIVSTGLAKEPEDVVFPAPIVRDGPGWRAVIDLPHGVTVGQVVDRRDRLASGLDLALGQVWPEGITGGSLRRLVLWVGDEDLSQTKPPGWPLRQRGSVDMFAEFPFGTDQRGNPVPMCLMFTNLLVGAIPRMGKTFSARLAMLAAGLDPTAEQHVYDFKGGQDWMCFEPTAHRIGIGDEPEIMAAALADFRGLRAEMSRRYKVVRGLPSDVCPEGKVTRELANKKSLRLHPIVVSVDECQVGFTHPDHAGDFTEIVTDLIKRGPAVGIIVILATQKPDKDSLPSGIRDNVGTRFGMRVMTWQVSDMVLGSGMAKGGFNAAALTRADRGIGYLVGASDDVEAQLARTYLVDAAGAAAIVERARAAREAVGTITGHAAGEQPQSAPSYSLLDDVAAVLRADEPKVWSETVVERLAELRPDAYTGWTPAQLTAGLKPYGVATSQVWGQTDGGKGRNKRGLIRDDVLTAIADRDNRKAIE